MLLMVLLVVAAVLLAALIVVLLRNEVRVKRHAYDYAHGGHRINFDRKRIGA